MLADCAGKHVVASPRLRGTLSVPLRYAAPEDSLAALAALEGLAVVELGGSLIELVPLGPRRLEDFGPDWAPARLPDGRLVDVRMEAYAANRNRGSCAALLGGRVIRPDDEIVLPGAPPGETTHVLELTANRCTLEVSGPSAPDGLVALVLVVGN